MLTPAYSLPQRGASLFLPAGLSGVQIAANTTGPGVRFRFPFRCMVIGIGLTVDTGQNGDLANIALSLIDGTEHAMITDGQGFNLFSGSVGLVGGVGARNVVGLGWGRRFTLQRLVQAGEVWTGSFKNMGATPLTPELSFQIGTPRG